MANWFNLFDFSSLGGNQLNKAISNQKLPTVAPYNPWIQPTYSPVKKPVYNGEVQISPTPQNNQPSGMFNYLKQKGAELYDYQQESIIDEYLNSWDKNVSVVQEMIKNNEPTDFIESTIRDNIGFQSQKDTIWGRIKSSVASRIQTGAESLWTEKTWVEKGVSLAKDAASLPFDIIGGIVTPLIEPIVKPVMESEPVQSLATQYGQFRQENPRLAQNIEATIWLWTILAPWTKAWQQAVKIPWKIVSEWAKVTWNVVKWIPNAIWSAWEYSISAWVWLSREAQQAIKKSPELYKKARTWVITTEWELENFVKATEKRIEDLSEVWKWYDKIKKWNIVATSDELSDVYLQATKDTPTTQLTKADKNVINDASDYISQLKWDLNESDILALRKQLDSIMYDPNTWLKRKLSPQWERLVANMRAWVDKIAKERIQWLKELDAVYWPEVSLLKDIKSKIYDSNGNIRENALSTISTIVWKNKAMKLDKFEKIYPQLWAKMRALKAYEEVKAIWEIKTWSIARQATWIWLWTAVLPWVWTFVWWMATNPNVVARILEAYWMAKNKINSILSKWSKITPQEIKEVQKAVKSVPKKEVESIIIKSSPKTIKKPSISIKKNENKSEIKKPSTSTTSREIPEGYIENPLTGEIIKKPKGMNAGFLKIGLPEKVMSDKWWNKRIIKVQDWENWWFDKKNNKIYKEIELNNENTLWLKNGKYVWDLISAKSYLEELWAKSKDFSQYSNSEYFEYLWKKIRISDHKRMTSSYKSPDIDMVIHYNDTPIEIKNTIEAQLKKIYEQANKPIKAPEKKIVKPDIDNALIEEARKYKSAEEYLNKDVITYLDFQKSLWKEKDILESWHNKKVYKDLKIKISDIAPTWQQNTAIADIKSWDKSFTKRPVTLIYRNWEIEIKDWRHRTAEAILRWDKYINANIIDMSWDLPKNFSKYYNPQ